MNNFPLTELRKKLFGNTFKRSKSGSAYKKILGFEVRLSDHYVSKVGGGSTNRGDIEIVLNPYIMDSDTFKISFNNREVDDLLYEWLETESNDTQELDEKGVLKMFEYLKMKLKKKMADGGEVGTTYQKGDRVLVKDGRVTRMATIIADGIDSNKRVRVRIDEFPFDKSIPVRPSNEIYVIEKMAKGGTMKHTKDYYKNLPKHNGYEWYSFDKGKHWFKKKEAKGYSVIKVTDKDIEDGSFQFMAQHNMSRMAKGGGVDEDREIHTFLVQVISEIGDTQYTIDANDGVQAFHKARYLFKKDNPNYNGDIDLSMIDKYAKGGNTNKTINMTEENLKRRLKFIAEDVDRLYSALPEEVLDMPVKGWENIRTLLANIEIATDLSDNESDNWKFGKKMEDSGEPQVTLRRTGKLAKGGSILSSNYSIGGL